MTDPVQPHPAASYYPAQVGAPEPPKDLTTLGVLAFAGAALVAFFTVLSAAVVGRAVRSGGGRDDTLDVTEWSVVAYGFCAIGTFIALVAAWVAGSMWLHRARRNAESFDPQFHHARQAGWAWGGWLVPIVNLWFPFQVVRDVHTVSTRFRPTSLVGWWWGLYIATGIAWRISSNIEDDALTRGTNASGVQGFSIVVAALTVAALVLWGLVLRTITRAQHERMYAGR